MLDWLYVGHVLCMWDEDKYEFVDEDGLFDDDDREFLEQFVDMRSTLVLVIRLDWRTWGLKPVLKRFQMSLEGLMELEVSMAKQC